ncbi:MAG: energy-coupling factor transporter ATPase [Solobacterium sp.]|nr:energy-coupling factor transporter ATPase [Solobacterium sp.]
MQKNIVEVKDLCFEYEEGAKTIEHVSFSIPEGSYTTIIGHNGSGKSTIAKLLAGLLEKKSGTIIIDGIELNEENLVKIRNKMGIVFQNPDNQFIGSTVRDDIAFGLENHCVPQEEMDAIIETNAERVGMSKYLEHEPTKLSGGQKQRVAIAGVLAMKPKLLIFDEATSMLDPRGKSEIKKVIKELHKESNLSIISITHDLDEVAASDLVVVMHKGHVDTVDTPHGVFDDEAKLKEMHLDTPFSMKLRRALEKEGVHVGNHITMEGMVKELCQSLSNT